MRRPLRAAAASVSGLLLLTALVACSGDDGPDPDDVGDDAGATAAALVEAFSSGDFSGVPFTEGDAESVAADYEEVVAGMGEVEPTVELGEVTEDGDNARAEVSWSWPVTEGEAWAYTSTLNLKEEQGGGWQVFWGHSSVEPTLNASSVLETTPVEGARGAILGAGGVALVAQRDVVRVGIDRSQVPKAKAGASASALARLVDVDAAPFVEQVKAAGPKAFVEAITYRKPDVPRAVTDGYRAIAGARLVADRQPLALTREFAAPILGTVGPVTAEMVEKDPDRYQAGDVAGLSGLQARYDEQLQGTPGVVVNAVGSDGQERELFRTDAGSGKALQITLDERLQSEAESLLADVGPASAVVAIRPSDGAILAAANGPGNGGQNLATFGQYAPGSTFKAVSSLALLRNGVTPETTVDCTATIDVDGRDFENYDDYPSGGTGRIPFRTAVANSCNTAFIAERDRLKEGDLAGAAASLGLGIDHDLGFPAYFGQVDPPTTETGRAADMIGQGTILASPMVMAAVIASIQEGKTVVPRMIDGVDVAVPDAAPKLTTKEADQLRGLLRGVVTDGSGRALASLPGPEVIAKTGTAEFEADGETRTHAWMIGAQGDLAVAVFVGEGSSGSGTAGPILEAFLRAAG